MESVGFVETSNLFNSYSWGHTTGQPDLHLTVMGGYACYLCLSQNVSLY